MILEEVNSKSSPFDQNEKATMPIYENRQFMGLKCLNCGHFTSSLNVLIPAIPARSTTIESEIIEPVCVSPDCKNQSHNSGTVHKVRKTIKLDPPRIIQFPAEPAHYTGPGLRLHYVVQGMRSHKCRRF
jgi:hypothetical protein